MTEIDVTDVTAPADASGETPAPAGAPTNAPTDVPTDVPTWRLGRLAVASGLAVSVIVHLALLGTVLFVSPLFGRPAPVYSVPVELVTPEQVAADTPSQTPDQPAQSSQPDPQSQSQVPAQADASPLLPQPSLPPDPFSQPPPSREAAAPPPPAGQPDLAKLVGLPIVGPSGGPSDYQADVAASAIAAFRARVQSCWATPAALADAPKVHIIIRVNLRRDGRFAAEPEPMGGSGGADAEQAVKVLLPSAIKALKKCQPYDVLPAEKYDEWHALDLNFSPNGLIAAAPPG